MKLSSDQVAFLDGYLDAFSDLPDGAWQAACESAIAESKEFGHLDPYDVWIAWVMATSSTVKAKP